MYMYSTKTNNMKIHTKEEIKKFESEMKAKAEKSAEFYSYNKSIEDVRIFKQGFIKGYNELLELISSPKQNIEAEIKIKEQLAGQVREIVLSEYKKGNVVCSTFEGLATMPLSEIVKQPTGRPALRPEQRRSNGSHIHS